MKKIRHSRLPITLESTDRLTFEFCKAIIMDFERYGLDKWIDEYGNWFDASKPNLNQLKLFNDK